MDFLIRIVLIVFSLLSIPQLIRWVAGWYREGNFDASARFILYVWGLNVVSWVAGRFLGGGYVEYGQYGESYSIAQGWVGSLERWSIPATIVLGLIRLTQILRENRRLVLDRASVSALFVVLAGSIGALAVDNAQTSFRQVLLVVLLLVAATTANGVKAIYGAAVAVWSLAIVSGLLLLVNASQATRPCRFDKCGPMANLYRGIFENENALGMALVMGLPFLVVASVDRKGRWIPLALVALSAYTTGSRTSQIGLVAAVVTGAVWFVFRAGRQNSISRLLAKTVLVLAVPITLVAQVWIVLSASNADYTNRAELWSWGLSRLQESWLFGIGWNALESFFTSTGGIAGASSYSLHNQFLDILVIGGIFGISVFLLTLSVMLVRTIRGDMSLVLILVPMLSMGTLETPWSFGQSDWLSWVMVAALMASSTRSRSTPWGVGFEGAGKSLLVSRSSPKALMGPTDVPDRKF